MLTKKATLFFLLISRAILVLHFQIASIGDGSNFPKEKNKGQRAPMGEDAHASSPFSLAVADGISGSGFISFYFAKVLANSAVKLGLLMQTNKNDFPFKKNEIFEEEMLEVLLNDIETYRKKTEEVTLKLLEKLPVEEEIRQKLNNRIESVASTMASCVFDNSDPKNPEVVIFHRGDSSVLVIQPNDEIHKGFATSFIFSDKTSELNFGVNKPSFFSLNKNYNDGFKNEVKRVKVHKNNLFILSTDGFTDNVHLSLALYAVNRIFEIHLDKEITKEIIENEMRNLAKTFIDKFVQKFFKRQKKIEKKRKNSDNGFFSMFCFFCNERSSNKVESPRKKPAKKNEFDSLSQTANDLPFLQGQMKFSDADLPIFVPKDFFDCSLEEIVQPPVLKNGKTVFLADCPAQALANRFFFSKSDLKKFQTTFNSRWISFGLGFLALELSKAKNNPSPFYYKIKKELLDAVPSGKRDDVTVLAGFVVDSEKNESAEETKKIADNWNDLLKNDQTSSYKEYIKDIAHFFTEILSKKLVFADDYISKKNEEREKMNKMILFI